LVEGVGGGGDLDRHRGGEVRERRAQAKHPTRARPELMADKPNMCWSWDIERHEALVNREELEDLLLRPVAAGW
jgi:hypothetical protein